MIIPTIGRDTLGAAVRSASDADEVLVVIDDARDTWSWLSGRFPDNVTVLHAHGGDHGYTARTVGIEAATGTHLAFLDDDDIYLPGSIDLFREHACAVPVVFRMDHYAHGVLWRDQALRFGNVSTQMFVVPNDRDKLGVWAPHAPGLQEPGGDFTFLSGCVEKMGGMVWREEIVAKLRPHLPSISIVTPWHNHPELWPDYATAVAARSPRDELVIVDNASVPSALFASVKLDRNEGFAAASNRGLHEATRDAVLFLNNDIAALRSDWLDRIRKALEPGVLVGASLRYDSHGALGEQPLPYLDGWCLAGMRDDLLELGGFDEEYEEPAYFSDNDLCLRARAAGLSLREVRVGLRHKTNGTSRDVGEDKVRDVTVANQSRFRDRAKELLGEEVAA